MGKNKKIKALRRELLSIIDSANGEFNERLRILEERKTVFENCTIINDTPAYTSSITALHTYSETDKVPTPDNAPSECTECDSYELIKDIVYPGLEGERGIVFENCENNCSSSRYVSDSFKFAFSLGDVAAYADYFRKVCTCKCPCGQNKTCQCDEET